MPVHDAEAHLRAAIASILAQSFADFELIVVDDRSIDGSLEIVRELKAEDARLRVVPLEEHVGVAGALNIGIAHAKATLVARMDADDIARPERFAVQVAEMERDSTLGLLGAQIAIIGHDGSPEESSRWLLPRTHDETVWWLLFGTPICHPTVVMRTGLVRDLGGYNPRFPNEDMELWTRMAFVARIRNVDDVLLDYRMPASLHTAKLAAWQPHITRVSQRYLERIVGEPVAEAVVLSLRGLPIAGASDVVFTALTNFSAASLLVHAFARMESLGVFCGDGVRSVGTLMESQVQELAARAHLQVAGRG